MPALALPGLRNSCALLTHASETPGIADTKKRPCRREVVGRVVAVGVAAGSISGGAGALRYGYGGGEDKWWTGGR